jgi:Ca2+-binding RTX toxin-like protein
MVVLLAGNDTRFGDTAGNFYDYNLTTVDANVAAGQLFALSFNQLRAGEDVTFNGAAETDGAFITYAGFGVETLTGGAGDDGFYFGEGRFGASEELDGGAGTMDQLGLQGDHTIVFGAGQLAGIEMIVCLTANDARFNGNGAALYNYDLTMDEGNLANGEVLVVSANQLIAGESLTFDGSAETDGGRYVVYGGDGTDVLTGGAGADELWGRGGADTLTGGDGNDTFFYSAASHSAPAGEDSIEDFTAGDLIGLAGIDAIAGGSDDAFSFVGNAAFSSTAGELRAVLQSGADWLVEGDVNGDGVADFALLVTVTGGHTMGAGDFIL